jgi:glyoxalase family protein
VKPQPGLGDHFQWPGSGSGYPGIGGTHHFAQQVADYEGLLKWKRRLTDLGLKVDGPLDRNYFKSIYFNDPDGTILEIATRGPGWTVDEAPNALGKQIIPPPEEMVVNNRDETRIASETWPEAVLEITQDMALSSGMHHITAIASDIRRTDAFFGLLGLRLVKRTLNRRPGNPAHWYWSADETGATWQAIPGDGYLRRDPQREREAYRAGQTPLRPGGR